MTYSAIMGTAVTGTIASAVGTATQTDSVLQWISLAVTIVGAIVSFIIIPVLNWIKDKKEKDETTIDDVIDLLEDIKDGADNVKKSIGKEDKEDENK